MMDSFPCLITPYPSKQASLQPSVPDVSLLLNPSTTNSYRNWKNNIQNEEQWSNMKAPATKKQVRFNNPNIPENLTDQNQIDVDCSVPRKTDSNPAHHEFSTPPLNKIFKNKQFKDVYMANIPNRNLDLSLIDLVTPVSKNDDSVHVEHNSSKKNSSNQVENLTQKVPTTYKEFLEMQHCERGDDNRNKLAINNEPCVTDIFNYTSPRCSKAVDHSTDKIKYCDTQIKHLDSLAKKNFRKNILNSNATNSASEINDLPNLCERSSSSHQEFKTKEVSDVQNMPGGAFSHCFIRKIDPKFRPQINLEQCDTAVQTSIVCDTDKLEHSKERLSSTDSEKNSDPTVKDLLKIIQQQNEQLLVLQKQVASLLDCRNNPKQIEAPPPTLNLAKDTFLTDAEQKEMRNPGSTPRKGALPKFSIDLMTSFEVSFRPQQNIYQRRQRDLLLNGPKIQEITETEGSELDCNRECGKKFTDSSLHLQEPISVRESCPSPEPSIKIDMKDYETSDEDEDDVTSGISSTFYRNLMDQVNKIIQNSQKHTHCTVKADELRNETLSRVKDATIKHLRKIGMNFSTIDEVSSSSRTNVSENDTSDQISFAVKQLLMKYLPDDQLAKLTSARNENITKKRNQEKILLNSRAPEFSFATVQFMKKYNLIATDGINIPQKSTIPSNVKSPRMSKKSNETNPKILDISSLKQQPKLL